MKINKENLIALILIVFCSLALFIGYTKPEEQATTGLVDNLPRDRVMVTGLEGVIYDSFHSKSAFTTLYNVANLKKDLNKAIEDPHVKAVLLRVNSPGGTVSASQDVYQLIKKLQALKKPVVISMSDVCASGCYYIASAADAIVANKGTITGSIGVISQGLNYKGLMDKLGVTDQTFKAGKFKDMGSPLRELGEEEKQILHNLLMDSYDQFLNDISSSRKMDRENLDKLAEGLIYTGRQALNVKLIDALGSYEDAKELTLTILKDKYDYKRTSSLKFDETFKQKTLSGFENLFDLGLSQLSSKLGLNLSPKADHAEWNSRYNVMWLMP